MKLYLPDNFIGYILEQSLPEGLFSGVSYMRSGDLAGHAGSTPSDIFLAPSIDLTGKKELYISGKTAAIIDTKISTGFMYYPGNGADNLSRIGVSGDFCKQDIILAKLMFNELYGSDPEIKITGSELPDDYDALLLMGNGNFTKDQFKNGIAWSDEVIELLDSSFVQYSFTSDDADSLKLLNSYADEIDERAVQIKLGFLKDKGYGKEAQKFVYESLNYLNFKMTEDDIESFNNLVRLPYFAGIYKEIPEFRIEG